jgi:hypothetical protein
MLSEQQLSQLSVEDREKYDLLDDTDRAQFEYFYGFTEYTDAPITVQNQDVIAYQQAADTIKLKSVAKLIEFTPHAGQKPIFWTIDEEAEKYNNLVLLLGRRCGKSQVTSVIVLRELLLPHSSTILLAPTFNNAQIIWKNVMQLVDTLNLPIKSVNRGQFKLELMNGARFSANSEMNIESSLGSSNSKIVVDEAQSIATLKHIIDQLLLPTLLDYGTRPSGILWGSMIFLGTPRGEDNVLTDYYYKELTYDSWKSFQAPSTSNPTLPAAYFEKLRKELPELVYRQEILAEIIGSDENVFHAFNKDINTYDDETAAKLFNEYSLYICGIDIGWSDSTANIFIYRMPNGDYYVQDAYSKNMTTTENHIKNYKNIESNLIGEYDIRYGDPAAAQALNDYSETYDCDVVPAQNDVKESIQYINTLFSPSGVNKKPRLYVHKRLGELIRQLTRVKYKVNNGRGSKDPFIKDTEGTHWDLIAALRYALYSDRYNAASISIITA